MAQPIRAIHAYRTILRTIRDVFNDDLRMQRAGNIQTRVVCCTIFRVHLSINYIITKYHI